jgi:VWFA-related protein
MYLGSIPFLAVALIGLSGAQDQKPTFKTGVELVPVEVQVVDRDGKPVSGLKASDFEVTIGGRTRPVISVELLQYASAGGPSTGATTAATATVPSAAGGPAQRRIYVLGVDEHSIRFGSARAALEASKRFIAQLGPDDLVGLVAYPNATTRVDPTTDRAQVLAALDKVRALFEPPRTQYNISAAEAIDIVSSNGGTAGQVVDRECAGLEGLAKMACANQVKLEGHGLGMALESTLAQSLSGLRGLLNDMGALPGRKILVLVSGGLLMSDRGVGRGDETGRMFEIGQIAARTNTTLYALHMDTRFLDAFAERRISHTVFRDESMFSAGLERVASAAGGTVFRIRTGSGDPAFSRVLLETSAQYLLGLDVAPEDRSDRAQVIKVKVKAKGATVRHRMSVVIPAEK